MPEDNAAPPWLPQQLRKQNANNPTAALAHAKSQQDSSGPGSGVEPKRQLPNPHGRRPSVSRASPPSPHGQPAWHRKHLEAQAAAMREAEATAKQLPATVPKPVRSAAPSVTSDGARDLPPWFQGHIQKCAEQETVRHYRRRSLQQQYAGAQLYPWQRQQPEERGQQQHAHGADYQSYDRQQGCTSGAPQQADPAGLLPRAQRQGRGSVRQPQRSVRTQSTQSTQSADSTELQLVPLVDDSNASTVPSHLQMPSEEEGNQLAHPPMTNHQLAASCQNPLHSEHHQPRNAAQRQSSPPEPMPPSSAAAKQAAKPRPHLEASIRHDTHSAAVPADSGLAARHGAASAGGFGSEASLFNEPVGESAQQDRGLPDSRLTGGGGSGSSNASGFTTRLHPTLRRVSDEGSAWGTARNFRARRSNSNANDIEEGGGGGGPSSTPATVTPKAGTLPGLLNNALGLRLPEMGSFDSTLNTTSSSFKWNQNPFTNLKDVWQSLPRVARVLLVWVAIEAVFILVYALTVLLTNTHQQFIFPLLITGIFLWYLVWDAVLFENSVQLFASMILAFALTMARIIANSVGKETLRFKAQALGWFILIMQVITIALALVTWKDFGWRLQSRLGVDNRRRGAKQRRRVHTAQAMFVTLIKLDVMWEISLAAVAVALAKAHSSNRPQAERLVAINMVGLYANLVIGWGAWTIVRHRTLRTLWPIVDILMPISFLQPALSLALVWGNGWEKWNAAYWDSLVVSAPLLALSRLAVWVCMHYILWRIWRLEKALGTETGDVDLDDSADLPEELLPLARGAWLGKPSQVSPRKRCFFQLSQDGSTLRWSWHKFIKLYYVDEVICNDSALSIRITMTVDRDLFLLFDNSDTYQTWVRGLDCAMEMLMGPGVGAPETPAGDALPGRTGGGVRRSTSGTLQTGTRPRPPRSARSRMLGNFGIRFTRQATSPTVAVEAPGPRSRLAGGEGSRWTFWNRPSGDGGSAAGGSPTHPQTTQPGPQLPEARVDRHQKARRLQMARFLDELHTASRPPISTPNSPARATSTRLPHTNFSSTNLQPFSSSTGKPLSPKRAAAVQAAQRHEAEAIAALEDSAARTRRPHSPKRGSTPGTVSFATSSGSPPSADSFLSRSSRMARFSPAWSKDRSKSSADSARSSTAADRFAAAAAEAVAAVDANGSVVDSFESRASNTRPNLETQSMVWARIMGARPASPQAAELVSRTNSRTDSSSPRPIASSASGIWARIMAGKADTEVETDDQENVAPEAVSAALVEGAEGAGELPRSATDVWARLMAAKASGDEQGLRDLKIVTPAGATTLGSGALSTIVGGLTPSPDLSPSLDGALSSGVPVDVVDYEDLRFGRVLGKGAQGEIYAAWLTAKGQERRPVAVKKFSRAADGTHEIIMHMSAGRNPTVVELRALCQHGTALYLIMELLPRGTLEVMLHGSSAKREDTTKLLLLIRSIAAGIQYLHSCQPPILHRDIKPGNLFVGVGQTIKVGDFGMARFVGPAAESAAIGCGAGLRRDLTCNTIGTAQYSAPELLIDNLPMEGDGRHLLAIDVYAFGVTLWEMITRQRPHKNLEPTSIWGMMMANPQELQLPPVEIPSKEAVPGERDVMKALAELVTHCTQFVHSQRPTMEQVLQKLDDIWRRFEAASLAVPPLQPSRPVSGVQGAGAGPAPPLHPGLPSGLANLAANFSSPMNLLRNSRPRSFTRAASPPPAITAIDVA